MSTRQTRILVVDDNELNLKLLRRVLELEGHEVTAAESIADFTRLLEAGDDVEARFFRATAYFRNRQPSEAESDFSRVLAAFRVIN